MIYLHKYFNLLIMTVLVMVLFSGCAGIPANHPDLLRAQNAYARAQSESWVNDNAPVEMYEADVALKQAKQAEGVKDLEHLSYLAERKVQIAVASAKQRLARKEIDELAQEKNKIMLEVREAEILSKIRQIELKEREAVLARVEAEKARIDAQSAKSKAEQLERELAELNAEKTDRGMVLTLGNVLFEFNKAELMPGAFRTIDKLVAFLEKYPERNVLIEGHTDSIGTEEYNLGLSQRRADAVRFSLLEKGISSNRIIAKGYGKNYPVASNVNEAGRQQNRRVEVIILDEGVSAESMLR